MWWDMEIFNIFRKNRDVSDHVRRHPHTMTTFLLIESRARVRIATELLLIETNEIKNFFFVENNTNKWLLQEQKLQTTKNSSSTSVKYIYIVCLLWYYLAGLENRTYVYCIVVVCAYAFMCKLIFEWKWCCNWSYKILGLLICDVNWHLIT